MKVEKYAVKGGSRPRWRYRVNFVVDGRRSRIGRGGFATEVLCKAAMAVHEKILKCDALTEQERQTAQRWNLIAASAPAAVVEATVSEPVESSPTLAAWIQEWLRKYAPDTCGPKTRERYAQLSKYITETSNPGILSVAQTPISDRARS